MDRPESAASAAQRRFGLLRPDPSGGDPIESLLAAIRAPSPGVIEAKTPPGVEPMRFLPTTREMIAILGEKAELQKRNREAVAAAGPNGKAETVSLTGLATGDQLGAELADRIAGVRMGRPPFVERLVLYWLDHFTVAAQRGNAGMFAGSFEREAIRPHLTGRFADMLVAAATHPSMLIYLDNQTSLGPRSKLGQRRKQGLNENLAREILELHTLGVDGGYTQADVEAFAAALTGWSVNRNSVARAKPADPAVVFDAFEEARHEPGAKTVLGVTHAEDGSTQAIAILRDLARRPATARHVARRLVRHFVGETADPAIATALAEAYLAHDGALGPVYEALVTHPAALAAAPRRLRPPIEHLMVIARSFDWRPEPRRLLVTLRALGQPYFGAASPKGWPDGDDDWAAGDSIKSRLDFTAVLSGPLAEREDPVEAARRLLGDALTTETTTAMRRAASRRHALAFLMMSPEVMRR